MVKQHVPTNGQQSECFDEEVLSAYLEKELDPSDLHLVGAHLKVCGLCQKSLGELEVLRRLLRAVPQESLARDVWPQIRARHLLSGQHAFWKVLLHRFWLLPVGAALGAASVLLWILILAPAPSSREVLESSPAHEALAALRQAEQKYQEAILRLENALVQDKRALDLETKKQVEQSLAQIESAIDKCRLAVRRNPDDLESHQAMLAAYQHKMDFIHELVATQDVPARSCP